LATRRPRHNCFKVDETSTTRGVDKVGSLITRGVLFDVTALKGMDMLPDTYEITVQDLQQALHRWNLTLQPGDAVIINPGRGKLWVKDNARAANWPVEVEANPDPQVSLPVHQILVVLNGITSPRT
jgi:Putative cyclase